MDALAEYSGRASRFRAAEEQLRKQFDRIGNWRLGIAVAAAVLAWLIFARQALGPWWLLAPALLFVALVVWHQRVLRRRTMAQRAVQFYDRGIARMQDRWQGAGSNGERFRQADHAYADDLDLFGKGGLFELLATTRTAAGEETLAKWLLQPATREEALRRQAAVTELSRKLDLREDIALLAEDVRADIEAEALAAWGRAPIVKFPGWLPAVGTVLGLCGLTAVVCVFAQVIPLWPLLAILGCDFALIFALRSKVALVLGRVETSGRDLSVFAALVERLEEEQFAGERLKELRAGLEMSGHPASKRIARLGRLVDWLDSTDHIIVKALRPLLLLQEQLAAAFERWRKRSGVAMEAWIRAVAEFEALSSLAATVFERSEWSMPNLLETSRGEFKAETLKHPLIPAAECIANDLEIGPQRPMLVVSGSNMSGKSTLLRAVGLNTVLAWAGGPVAAKRLDVSALQIGASIRVNDSLQDHRSRFFAEIMKIRLIVELTKQPAPVLFLLDELLSGTNSHDRRIGAAGIVRELLRANAIGLMTTHDLALAHVQQDVAGVENVHFEDQMDGTEMRFDYKLKPGVVTRSNALELMRAVGLEV